MPENERQFDKDFDMRISPRLPADLKAVLRSQRTVPPEVDRAVLDQVHRHLSRRYRPRRQFRWAASIAAAAAVVIFAFIFNIAREPTAEMARETAQDAARKRASYTARKSAPALVSSVIAKAQVDIDQNGRVDLLDAFKLARHVESKSTERAKIQWDINGDGLVNRNDVDLVASAAVRLDKGVL
ncbi:MAG: dockerin type I domain-containing protein [Planctomycetota bacterium]